jgi:hypothetical protein
MQWLFAMAKIHPLDTNARSARETLEWDALLTQE